MLENTAHATDKVPNTLALVASQMVVEKAKEFKEQARQAAEQARRAESERLRQHALESGRADDKDPAGSDPAQAKLSEPASSPAADAPAQPDARGVVVDLNV